MRFVRWAFLGVISLGVMCVLCGPERAHGDLHWQWPKKEPIRLRLVALAWNHPRSSFFANEETFIAEKQLTKEESRLVKLIYNFLPYQPRLSDYGLDYSTVHELRAVRDPECDEKLAQMIAGEVGDWRQQEQSHLTYASDAPVLNTARSTRPLPCYVTNAEDYDRPVPEVLEDPAR
jgi:hypothetical protein